MLKQYEEIAVLEQGDDGAIVSIRGAGGPSVLLGSSYLAHLQRVVAQAKQELARRPAASHSPGINLLCAEIQTILTTHLEACNKYEGRTPAPMLLAAAMEELAELRRQINVE